MEETILLGRGNVMLEVPAQEWRKQLAHASHNVKTMFSFMTEEHQLVRSFVVRELPRNHGEPLKPEDIAQRLSLPLARVVAILEDLQKNLFFVVRNNAGEVNWAFPVTSERTAHCLSFSTDEGVFGAWAEDALATSFVQGHLRHERLVVEIETECVHCGQELHLTVDSELQWSVKEMDARPLLFVPDVDWKYFKAPNIIDAYWRNCVFFWSEEHARDFRVKPGQVDGKYLTLAQSAYFVRTSQARLFGFEERREGHL